MKNTIRLVTITAIIILVLVTTLFGCSKDESVESNNYYFLLMGESNNWELKSYEIIIDNQKLKAGSGTLIMKYNANHITDYFTTSLHMVIDNEDRIIQGKELVGTGINIDKVVTGSIEGKILHDKNGEPISIENINDIYMIIEWNDKLSDIKMKEQIDLFPFNK